ncbi:MAG: UDP-N-acetylmuramate:L-alanyl-gamma-D-glutamyl-meso-diaminopimelate ligase [Desulfomonile tiedjei]|uniref:UDP-N-acetylmuramate:L-alanyl-gamma-D-glutamyl-meso-diaminopimelate ligase n=1 Tax=Desulfomonile tiedjei TaxID=2358 RepID=A0A9D6V8L7_9BACT|nr:UDP-N-acetylmuramate:L-alanyl-gamma-D-glutamyl-meso-diaminopimelate ligase [Desulfomonile tiedjei]
MNYCSIKKVNNNAPRLEPPAHIHLMGICGTGMGSLAGMFHSQGYRVSGSDQAVYPPMSDFLKELGIQVLEGYKASNLSPRPDLVVVGNVIRKTNPEAIALDRSAIPFTSMPMALKQYFAADKTRIVVSGTHGKTTVSAMIAWVLFKAGLEPGFMIGGLPKNFAQNHRVGNGSLFVIEGDEYDTAYFDKHPKFLHYCPHLAVITSCEFDHADIYADLDSIKDQFRALVRLIPADGAIIAFGGDETVREIVQGSEAPTFIYGEGPLMDWSVGGVSLVDRGISVTVSNRGRKVASGTLPVIGRHNVLNAVAAIAASAKVGVDPQVALDALGLFQGVKRRQETIGEHAGITVIDDFAHHPTAVEVTCSGVKTEFPLRRLVAVFEPRTNTSRRAIFQKQYASAFGSADLILIREPRDTENIPLQDRFDSQRLAEDLRSIGKNACAFESTDAILQFLTANIHRGDVVLIMSNGSFDNLGRNLLARVREVDHEGSDTLR